MAKQLAEIEVDFEEFEDRFMDEYKFLCYPEEIKTRIVAMSGGRASGKSHGMGEAYPYYTFVLPHNSTLIAGQKHYNKIGRASFKNIKDKIFSMGLQDCFKFKESPYEIKNRYTGTIIGFVGLDNSDSLKSIEDVSFFWMEEGNQITSQDFRTINLSLRNENCIIFLTWNPINPFDYTENDILNNPHRIEGKHYTHVHTTYLDNPFLPDGFIEEMDILKKHNPKIYQRDGLGLPVPHEGIIFADFEVEEFDYSCVQTVLGRDFGFNDADVTMECWIDTDEDIPKLYICNELYFNGDNIANQPHQYTCSDVTKKFINSDLYEYDKIIIAESDPDKIIEMNRIDGINAVKVQKHHILKPHQLEIMQGWDIVIHPQCVRTIKEFRSYAWAIDKKTGILKDEPVDGNDHCIDSIRYAISKILLGLVKNNTVLAGYVRTM